MRNVMFRPRWAALLAPLALFAPFAAAQPAAPPAASSKPAAVQVAPKPPSEPVKIDSGSVRGYLAGEKKDVRVFKGIPYAAPPTGDLRWADPQPPAPWNGIRECLEFSNASMQSKQKLPIPIPGFSLAAEPSEDSLYLNVFAPAEPPKGGKLPVMVWIHGGGYVIGAASQPLYDATQLARRGVVAVTLNYRLGAFGFMAHPALSAASKTGTSGNYGILDQIEALKWVQRNAAAFGGDPGNVTIFGESAGGGSVLCLLVSPLAKGLFHRAIAESAPIMTIKHMSKSHYGYPSMEEVGENLMAQLGLPGAKGPDGLKAMRAIPAEKISEAVGGGVIETVKDIKQDFLRFAPIVDGRVIPDDPNTLLDAGKVNNVPLIIGTNRDEGTMFTAFANPVKTAEDFGKFIRDGFGEGMAERIFEHYPVNGDHEVKPAMNAAVRDYVFVTQARWTAKAWAKIQPKTFVYHFAHVASQGIGKSMGAHHGAEIPYVFNNPGALSKATPEDLKLGEIVSGKFARFAATGDPAGAEGPEWPAYNPGADALLEFGPETKTVQSLFKKECDLIEEIVRSRMPGKP